MGQIRTSAPYDDVLEKAALAQLQRSTQGGAGGDQDVVAVRAAVRALDVQLAECGASAVRLKSPHRKTGLAWESLALDYLEQPGDPLRQTLLTLASARVVCRTLDLPKEFMGGLPGEAIRTAQATLKRFRDEAGLSGAVLEAFTPDVFPQLVPVRRGRPGRPGDKPC